MISVYYVAFFIPLGRHKKEFRRLYIVTAFFRFYSPSTLEEGSALPPRPLSQVPLPAPRPLPASHRTKRSHLFGKFLSHPCLWTDWNISCQKESPPQNIRGTVHFIQVKGREFSSGTFMRRKEVTLFRQPSAYYPPCSRKAVVCCVGRIRPSRRSTMPWDTECRRSLLVPWP